MVKLKNKIKNFRITRSVFAYPYILFMLLFVVIPLALILVNAFLVDGRAVVRELYRLVAGRRQLVYASAFFFGGDYYHAALPGYQGTPWLISCPSALGAA